MQWSDEGIVLRYARHGERGIIVEAFTREYGRHGGMARGISKQLHACQPGTLARLTWQARLEEHLGYYTCEPVFSLLHALMHDSLKLKAVNSISALLLEFLPDRDPHPALYDHLKQLLLAMHADDPSWLADYCRFELLLLKEMGFRLSLDACVATGETGDLAYVSPKSGAAVCRASGLPYHDKMLPLPPFLLPHRTENRVRPQVMDSEIVDALKLTGYFLGRWLAPACHRDVPAARGEFCGSVQRTKALHAA